MTAPSIADHHSHDGRPLDDVDYVTCANGHESEYMRHYPQDRPATLDGHLPDTSDADGAIWQCSHPLDRHTRCDETVAVSIA